MTEGHFTDPELNKIIAQRKRAKPVWFDPQMLIDMAEVLVCAMDHKILRKELERSAGISLDRLAELADKLRKEVDKL